MSDVEEATIIFPSGKLGAITRVKNECNQHIESGEGDPAYVEQLLKKFDEKVTKFEEACLKELQKEGLEEEKNSLKKWQKKQLKMFAIFYKKTELWILENQKNEGSHEEESSDEEEEEEEEEEDQEEDSSLKKEDSTAQLLEALLKNQTLSKLPSNEPDTFNGSDITEYRSFILSFERLIEKNCTSDEDRYYYLLKYTEEEANQLVKSCYNSNAKLAFKNAKKTLSERYGNDYRLAQNYLDKLMNWQAIKSEDSNGLSKFAAFLTTCLNMMDKMTALNQLNSWRDIKDIIMKLPYDLRKQFRSLAQKEVQKGNQVTFQFLVKFVNDQANLLNMPLFGEISDKKNLSKTKYESKQDSKASHKNFYAKERSRENRPCECCKKTNHVLDDCKFFLQKTMSDRQEFVAKRKLCYGCLKEGHMTKNCTNRMKCKRCQGKHPTSLHREQKPVEVENDSISNEENNNTLGRSMNMTTKSDFKTICPAIPVIVRNKSNNECITTYAALDNFSTSCYMDENLMKQLKIVGKESPITVTTIEGQRQEMKVTIVNNLEIRSLEENNALIIPKIYAKKNWPFTEDDSPKKCDVENIPQLKDVPFQFIDKTIGILIGMNMPEILKPLKIVASTKKGAYASLHQLGWALNGPIKGESSSSVCFRIKENEQDLNYQFNQAFGQDFVAESDVKQFSVDDRCWLEFVEANTQKLPSNQLEIGLPIKNEMDVPDNYNQVYSRLKSLVKKLTKDEVMLEEYCNFMDTMIERDFMEKVPEEEINLPKGNYSYLTHHGVRHKQKKKLRIVFDCSLRYNGTSLNDCLWKGPDLANTLIGVLLRFRINKVGVSADIEKMFHMIRLPKKDRDYLRFLWFENNDLSKEPVIFRMKVHLFGATSSPAIANFALKKSLQENPDLSISSSFYVDDMLDSYEDDETAITAVADVRDTLVKNGFNLTSFNSNSRKVLNALPKEKLSKYLEDVNITDDDLPQERTLGLVWKTDNDTVSYSVTLTNHPNTKRGVLSTLSSIYDPLFLVSPALIKAKRIFQICCHLKLDWDSPLPEQYAISWQKWKDEIPQLNEFQIPRCYKVTENVIDNVQLHIFADGSEIAYGAVAYLRQEDTVGDISISIVYAKARLTPLNRSSLKTTPRIELNAAKLAVTLYNQIKKEFENHLAIHQVFFWTDSAAVLRYIFSETGHFQTFVANRVAYIRSQTDLSSWHLVPGEQNPADLLSRGTSDLKQFIQNETWVKGPLFLMKSEDYWPEQSIDVKISMDDPELKKKSHAFATKTNEVDATTKLLNSTSSYHKLKCRVAVILRLRKMLQKKIFPTGEITVQELEVAENEIWRYTQRQYLWEVHDALKKEKQIPRRDHLRKLNLFLDKDNLIRVGGRLQNASLPFQSRHPLLLHGDALPVQLLIINSHRNLGHLGRETVSAELRQKYHIIGETKHLKKILRTCVICRKTQGRVSTQLMANLPKERVTVDLPPFTNTATDLFGPFYATNGKKQEKRYGIIFTCLASRAAHLEIAASLDTDSFLNAFRRFVARRGVPASMRSDNGTNLTAADKELKAALNEWNTSKVDQYCQRLGIDWKFQPPQASHFGGVFEREIRTIRKILNSMLQEFHNRVKLNDEVLHTLFCEIENILNSRPLTAVLDDGDHTEPLTPNHILRLSSLEMLPPGLFNHKDIYLKRRWRQAQYLADVFWQRFRKEYLPLLQQRSKWVTQQRSHKPGDIVMVVEPSAPRNEWTVGIISSVKVSEDGSVRSCDVEVLKNKFKNNFDKTVFNRPISKLVLLCPVDGN